MGRPFQKSKQEQFQFHTGTIKSVALTHDVVFHVDFNSTLVRLREAHTYSGTKRLFNFNSTLVRLRGIEEGFVTETIDDFNSTLVRLRDHQTAW